MNVVPKEWCNDVLLPSMRSCIVPTLQPTCKSTISCAHSGFCILAMQHFIATEVLLCKTIHYIHFMVIFLARSSLPRSVISHVRAPMHRVSIDKLIGGELYLYTTIATEWFNPRLWRQSGLMPSVGGKNYIKNWPSHNLPIKCAFLRNPSIDLLILSIENQSIRNFLQFCPPHIKLLAWFNLARITPP
jgi:hypothetical protein